ncbi:hypothetical protein BOX15_Mlig015540g1 [Macrostomum lignano]|uniref:EGF-like domain-containing protein n=1 Tax=Macrostomum lignano TaxID=282301 RepID=A0A267E6Z9_9PLAT|nr:hypothetical protein BOX15_Mlig015540g1 [Macrostomum lignano]
MLCHRIIATSLLLLLIVGVDCRRRGRWKSIPPLDGQQECGSDFHDPQSKWLQSPLVVQARWRSADEHPADPSGAFNITVTVEAALKKWRRDIVGLRITVGQFNRSLGRRQRSLQRRLCSPRNLPRNGARGYILFLTPTEDANYFRHRFLPVRNTRSNRGKIARIQCREPQHCPEAPEVTQEARLRGGSGGRRRLLCSARGQPMPRPHWLKDGVEVQQTKDCVAQFRTKSGTVMTRLTLKNYSDSAGNYTCVFRNLNGSAASSIVLKVEPAVQREPTRRLVCDSSTKCLHGGTCTVDQLTEKQVCICPAFYTGTLCEKFDYQEGAAVYQSQAAVAAPISSAALGVVFVAVFAVLAIVLLSVCLMLYKVRRRLDRRLRRSRLSSRCDNVETQYPSNGTATLTDVATMTETPAETLKIEPQRQESQQPKQSQQMELHRLPDSVSTNGAHPPPRLPRPSNNFRPQQQQQHTIDYAGLPIRPIFDYSGGLHRDESADLRAELGLLNQLERRQLQQQQQQQLQPRHQQPRTMQVVEESEGVDEADAATEALLPFPGHGQRRMHHSTS